MSLLPDPPQLNFERGGGSPDRCYRLSSTVRPLDFFPATYTKYGHLLLGLLYISRNLVESGCIDFAFAKAEV